MSSPVSSRRMQRIISHTVGGDWPGAGSRRPAPATLHGAAHGLGVDGRLADGEAALAEVRAHQSIESVPGTAVFRRAGDHLSGRAGPGFPKSSFLERLDAQGPRREASPGGGIGPPVETTAAYLREIGDAPSATRSGPGGLRGTRRDSMGRTSTVLDADAFSRGGGARHGGCGAARGRRGCRSGWWRCRGARAGAGSP